MLSMRGMRFWLSVCILYLILWQLAVLKFISFLAPDCTGPTKSGLQWLSDAGFGQTTGKYRWRISRLFRRSSKLPLDKLIHTYDPNVTTITTDFPSMTCSTVRALRSLIPVESLGLHKSPLTVHVFPMLFGMHGDGTSGTIQIFNNRGASSDLN